MSTTPTRVFVARLVGLPIFDPQGDQVAKVRDLVVALRTETSQPRVLGMVAEVFGRRRIFVPMTRITAIDSKPGPPSTALIRWLVRRPQRFTIHGMTIAASAANPLYAANNTPTQFAPSLYAADVGSELPKWTCVTAPVV